ncbi:MAG: NAD(P)H-dependent oxidoreductase subunit E [Phycisphaerae bacterium]|jgi:NADH-quinone oxidoreductase E subunit|nr:NAD(P)H-dependent oxidoreductase subunit E [Phycisphaerae bacterium]MBT5365704.1 NAD(P)H-dependent oxidoreductase subunit E [Phycisphaerae bacterium]MBT6270453.1 NAD(P)H-dependent oxidoreductase subunit E [Phycisphaerae bacterium]MBT6283419.1 NAD(P)H-dependent oxidoreductase subunit E [Phycisphaerae bacterium]
MAWIAKQSANTKLQKRDVPYLTPVLMDKITKDIMPRYATGQGALMTTLHEVQHEYGYIPWEAMVEIAKVLGITPAQVADVVSFYEDYSSEPLGKYVVGICQSIACEVCGHQALIDHLKNRLGVDVHETTADGKFTLLGMECIGACDNAPCALVNGKQYNNLSISMVDDLVDRLSEEA